MVWHLKKCLFYPILNTIANSHSASVYLNMKGMACLQPLNLILWPGNGDKSCTGCNWMKRLQFKQGVWNMFSTFRDLEIRDVSTVLTLFPFPMIKSQSQWPNPIFPGQKQTNPSFHFAFTTLYLELFAELIWYFCVSFLSHTVACFRHIISRKL